jgi:hypothetical protein
MARRNRMRETDLDIKEEIYRVAVTPPEHERLSAPKTLEHLKGKFPGRINMSEDSVLRRINDLKQRHNTPAARLLDSIFEWHYMEEYGLPLEAGQFLVDMQTWCTESAGGPIIFTVRAAKWCWRIHLTAPELAPTDLWLLAQKYIRRELNTEILGQPLDMRDLDEYLGYRPWTSEEHRNRYKKAVQEGRVSPPKSEPVNFSRRAEVIDGLKTLNIDVVISFPPGGNVTAESQYPTTGAD